MSKSESSFFALNRETLLMFGVVFCFVASGLVAGSTNAQGRVIRASTASIPAGVQTQVRINILLESQGDESSTSFSLRFNPFGTKNPVVALGSGVPAGANLQITTNNLAEGQLGVRVNSTNTFAAGTRNIITVTFTVPANANVGIYPVGFGSVPTPQNVLSSTGESLVTTYQTGFVQVGATAAGVDVSGRVVTPDGPGLRNAIAILTDALGNRRTATTSSFGYYRFADVESGKTYAIGVQSKHYRFTPRVIQIVDILTDFDFIGQD